MWIRFTGNSELVAELAAINGFKAAFAIRDGAEGNRGWKVFHKLLSPSLCLSVKPIYLL